jgi:hypothetical protein
MQYAPTVDAPACGVKRCCFISQFQAVRSIIWKAGEYGCSGFVFFILHYGRLALYLQGLSEEIYVQRFIQYNDIPDIPAIGNVEGAARRADG